jgi:hypothetical protein
MKVFVIGGHKNGTLSIHNWFVRRGLKSFHLGSMWKQINGKWDFMPVLVDKYPEFNCYSDHFAEFGFTHKIIELNEKYPEAKFILNYRPLNKYMNSLLKHLLNGNNFNSDWKWPSDFSQRIINTHKVNYFAVDYFKKNNKLDKLIVINVCNGENEKNTRILEKFLDLPYEKNIILKRMTHNLLPISNPKIQKYYKLYKDDIELEINKVKEELTDEKYLGFLKLLPENYNL